MTQDAVEPQHWPASRWYFWISLVLVIQFGLIFWLGKPQRIVPPPPGDLAPLLQLTRPDAAKAFALTDPTLFALPHQESFSGPAWLNIPVQEFHPVVNEPSPLLTLAKDDLGAGFQEFMVTNQVDGLPAIAEPELALKIPAAEESSALPAQSRLRVTGALAGRHMLAPPALPSWPSADLLTNSIVQILVGPDGKPVSPTLLTKSLSPDADQYAIRAARNIRFEPLALQDPTDPLAGLSWGQLIFEWRTLPLPATNSPAEVPLAK